MALLNVMHNVNMYVSWPVFFFKFLVYDYPLIKVFDSFFVTLLRSMKSDHVKTNLVHKFHRVQSFGIMKLEEFKDLLTPDQYTKCLKKGGKKTWFTFTFEFYTQFLYKVGILIHVKFCY